MVAKPRKSQKKKKTIYYMQIYINSLDFANDPISLHNYICGVFGSGRVRPNDCYRLLRCELCGS